MKLTKQMANKAKKEAGLEDVLELRNLGNRKALARHEKQETKAERKREGEK